MVKIVIGIQAPNTILLLDCNFMPCLICKLKSVQQVRDTLGLTCAGNIHKFKSFVHSTLDSTFTNHV